MKVVIDNISIDAVTERTVTDKKLLMAQIKEIRRQGYAVSAGEQIRGTLCISVPVRDYLLPVVLSVIGPEVRLRKREREVIKELKAGSAHITENIRQVFQGKKINDAGVKK